jgi:hypothetical protein
MEVSKYVFLQQTVIEHPFGGGGGGGGSASYGLSRCED